jgi:hypothetical protein
LKRETGGRWGIAISLDNPGPVAHMQGEYGRPAPLRTEALRIGQGIGARDVLAEGLEMPARCLPWSL